MRALFSLTILWCGSILAGQADSNSAALDKLRSIAPADPKYPELWQKIPCIMLTDKGAFINGTKTPIPYDQVLPALADLPKTAWPCGRLIVFWPSPPGLTTQHPPPQAVAEKVEAELKAATLSKVPTMSM